MVILGLGHDGHHSDLPGRRASLGVIGRSTQSLVSFSPETPRAPRRPDIADFAYKLSPYACPDPRSGRRFPAASRRYSERLRRWNRGRSIAPLFDPAEA